MQPASSDDQKKVNQFILKLHDECGFPYIITCDEHYLTKNDRSVHKAFLNSQDAEREVDDMKMAEYMERYINEEGEVKYRFKTRTDGNDTCRSVAGCFENKYIEPNIKEVIDRINIFENEN